MAMQIVHKKKSRENSRNTQGIDCSVFNYAISEFWVRTDSHNSDTAGDGFVYVVNNSALISFVCDLVPTSFMAIYCKGLQWYCQIRHLVGIWYNVSQQEHSAWALELWLYNSELSHQKLLYLTFIKAEKRYALGIHCRKVSVHKCPWSINLKTSIHSELLTSSSSTGERMGSSHMWIARPSFFCMFQAIHALL